MSDDMFIHFSSNSSNQSDQSLPTKIAKLEARLVGKGSVSGSSSVAPPAQAQPTWPSTSAAKFGVAENLAEPSTSSDSDDDSGGEFLIQANTSKRQKLEEGNGSVSDNAEVVSDEKRKIIVNTPLKTVVDTNKRKQGRGRPQGSTGRARGSKSNEQTKAQTSPSAVSAANGQVEISNHKDMRSKELFGNGGSVSREDEMASLRIKVANLEEELRKAREEAADHKRLRQQLEKELKERKECEEQMKPKKGTSLDDRAGTVISETWEDGQALKDINAHLRQLLEAKEIVERQRKSLRKRQSDKGDGGETESVVQEEDFLIQDEIYKSRLASIKREEEAVLRERDRYELEKGRLIREMKRIRDEDGSRFNNFPILNHRYALLNLLGKGGFSEVYKAFDLVDHRYVACKLHGLNPQWSEDKKQSYIRHAIREYNIHKSLVHNNIVRLWDTFEIDQNTFCTVLEFCSGKDLDAVLKATPVLPEKEARIIIVQIFQGLVYLNKRTQKIIHYDLKPGNVLFDELGVAKLTDFGLSKIVEEDVGSQGMELTSQGAGTYWYLPPECFELHKTPLISSKVDVWSAGVLFYQMLFGKRPFGHDQTQERILREDTIIKARKVDFPSRPSVSTEAKELIRRCLTYKQGERPDVLSIAQDPYLTYAKK
ncbi:hypothetical protein Cgig2_015938 [Carnegiea gigantea]|uniref:Protein kinase domain-containing protein n=1 Tax=Carnegiea gigantea TaxID=171969 RepID=A0A9Q1KMV1_9CARY|nr:hypothetical protein Cgig2_015938 [Carnegiea gigantea]